MLSATPLRPADPHRIGPFTLLGRLAEGGMGTVFLGRYDGRAESLVAVKTLRQDLADDPVYRARFVSECDASRRVSEDPASSSYVARLIDSDAAAAVPWLASEFIPGPTLHHEAARRGGLPPRDLLTVAAGLASVISALHGHGFTHGDVKPLNVVLGPDGVRLLDLGLARRIDGPAAGPAFGSPGWSPPGHRDGDPASDVHGWGMCVAYAATGASPFGAGSPDERAARMVASPPDLEALPGELRPWVVAALAPDPALRPTADEVAEALRGRTDGATRPTEAVGPLPTATQGMSVPTMIEPGEAIGQASVPAPSRRVDRRRVLAAAAAAVLLVTSVAALTSRDDATTAAQAAPAPRASAPSTTAPSAPARRAEPVAAPARAAASAPAKGTGPAKAKGGPQGKAGKGKGGKGKRRGEHGKGRHKH